MKPKYLEISAWGPFLDKVIVDFTKIGKSGLFLITGPTGAGKTTIFDAICFALFGDVSGTIREKDSVRSDFAKPDTKTYVKLTFQHKKEEYFIYRNPKYLRPRLRGEGFTTEGENAILTFRDGSSLEGTARVNPKMEELLGMNYSQFKQISMIAQGEFQKLLFAGSKERTEIFRNIFNTQLYEKMQIILSQRTKALRGKIIEIKNKADEAITSVINQDDKWQELIQAESYHYERIVDYLENHVKINQEKVKELQKLLDETEDNIKAAIVEKNNKMYYIQLFHEYDNALKQFNELKIESKEIQKKEQQLEKIKRAFHIKATEAEYNLLSKQNTNINNTIQKQQAELLEMEDIFKQIYLKYSKKEAMEIEKEEINKNLQNLKSCEELLEDYGNSNAELTKLQTIYLNLQEKADQKNKEYLENDSIFRKAAIGFAAKYLEEGKPCPVCGSIHHPQKAIISDEVPDENKVSRLKKEYEALYEKASRAKENAASCYGQVKVLTSKLVQAFQFIHYEKTSETYEEVQIKLRSEVAQKSKQLAKLSKEYNSMIDQYNSYHVKLENKKALLEKAKEEKLVIEENHQIKEVQYQKALQENGFETEEEYKGIVVDAKIRGKLEQSIKLYYESLKSGADHVERLEKELADKERPDIEEVNARIQILEKKKKEIVLNKEYILTEISSNKRALTSLTDKLEKRRVLEEEYGKVSDVEKITRGDNKQRLVFEQFVLINYFEDILSAANIRLNKMTSGRYELSRIKHNKDARTKNSLDIEVLDHYTGKLRHVNTLSGGESFKAALALALGTSDIIQNNAGGIQVDTLFVDEGFGSLDSESLEQAIDTLVTLVGNNRLIGIISHVGELKERIDKQIQVDKTNIGSSITLRLT